MSGHVRHLYVHLPFCAHRCGYCDFVTVVGRDGEHDRYVDALLRELELERGVPRATTSRPSSSAAARRRSSSRVRSSVCFARCRAAEEVTVEANPETVTPELAALLRATAGSRASRSARRASTRGCSRCSSAARSPTTSGARFYALRDAGFDNISLDLIYGIPGQSPADLERDLDEALALEPDHLSCYELEAKPGTRFTHTFGDELARQADAMEDYFERVVERLTGAGYRWYETANFCRPGAPAGAPDYRARHNLAYWHGRDYLGLGVGAVSTVAGERRRNLPGLRALRGGARERDASRRGRSSTSTARRRAGASVFCSACASTSRCRSPASSRRSTTTALAAARAPRPRRGSAPSSTGGRSR